MYGFCRNAINANIMVKNNISNKKNCFIVTFVSMIWIYLLTKNHTSLDTHDNIPIKATGYHKDTIYGQLKSTVCCKNHRIRAVNKAIDKKSLFFHSLNNTRSFFGEEVSLFCGGSNKEKATHNHTISKKRLKTKGNL